MYEQKPHLAQQLEATNGKERYNACVKKFLSNKQILARIMKETVSECKGMVMEDIEVCIEGVPEMGTAPIYPGKKSEAITGIPTEDKVPSEGEVTFDIRFRAVVPKEQGAGGEEISVGLIIDMEAQNSFNPGYPIVTRGIVYGARMLSGQIDTDFKIPHYDQVKKVYSIWICTDCPQYAQNTIEEYHFTNRHLYGELGKHGRHDLISVVLVCLGEDKDEKNELLGMLGTILKERATAEEKNKLWKSCTHCV